jgi:DNA-binding YbaB/EbfC family protein
MFNKGNMSKMLKQAQEVQKQIEDVQNELDDLNINGESGGGMVKATVNGKMELLNLNLQAEIFEEDKDLIEDLIIAAINNAMSKAQEESQNRMNAVTGGMLGGMKIPGM